MNSLSKREGIVTDPGLIIFALTLCEAATSRFVAAISIRVLSVRRRIFPRTGRPALLLVTRLTLLSAKLSAS